MQSPAVADQFVRILPGVAGEIAGVGSSDKPIERLDTLQLLLECEEEIRRLRARCVRQEGNVLIATIPICVPVEKQMRLEGVHERRKNVAVYSWFAVASVEALEVIDVYVGNAYRDRP